jgi:glycosyltransferase involved in cell wall biosynthesis
MARAMPEIEHGVNALLAESADDFADHVTTLLRDDELRRRIAQGGRDTWEREFLPEVVVGRVVERIRG